MADTAPKIVLGIGSGRCGTMSLATLLDRQPAARVTHERRPLLPWHGDTQRLVKERIEQFRGFTGQLVGDVASFYLPYVEAFVSQVPQVRIIAIRRDCEEVVRSFCVWSDHAHSAPADHWSERPAPGLFHDPVWSTIFPKYATDSREEGVRRYWREYYQQVGELCERFPENVRLFEMEVALNTEEGQRELLTFAGVEERDQVIDVGLILHQAESDKSLPARQLRQGGNDAGNDRSKCVVLVPHGGQIVPACEDSLQVLERRGYVVRRVRGYSQIDVARNEIASKAILDGFMETMWIDADTGFHPDAVDKLRAHQLPVVCGIYPKKGKRELAVRALPGQRSLVFGKRGGLHEIEYAATGFLFVRRQVYLDIQDRLGLPLCNEHFGADILPYFLPMVRPYRDGHWYLGEDYAFCERVRQAGYKIMADTTIRLWHIGTYPYGWEDAGREVERFQDYVYHFGDPDSPEQTKKS